MAFYRQYHYLVYYEMQQSVVGAGEVILKLSFFSHAHINVTRYYKWP